MKSQLSVLQSLGRALMLPIAVLPIAGLFLRLGQPDLLDVPLIAAAGETIFAHLGLLFAIGVAVGFARDNNGAAALAGVVCFLVATSGVASLVATTDIEEKILQKFSVPLGILSGAIAGYLYNRFSELKLPEYLAFFGGRRFVPIISGVAGLGLAVTFGFGAAPIEHSMNALSAAVMDAGQIGLFLYGALNRLLIVTGLHHILNNLAWFIVGDYQGVTGDLKRYFAGDPSAGAFMAGFFPVIMFGLPAACLAMYHAARVEQRKAIGGMLLSLALTAFLTGVTEPIEFSFMFLAPMLYAIHMVLTGLAMVTMDLLNVRLGFGFSAGLVDYILNFNKATHPLLLLPVGLGYFALYYCLFRIFIAKFNLQTPGRALEAVQPKTEYASTGRGNEHNYVQALGGAENIVSVDACTTRLRLVLKDTKEIDEPALKTLGARGVLRLSETALQVVIGPQAERVADEIRASLNGQGSAAAFISALGGQGNVRRVDVCSSRLRVEVLDRDVVDDSALRHLGVRGVVKPEKDSVHIVIGPAAEQLAMRLQAILAKV